MNDIRKPYPTAERLKIHPSRSRTSIAHQKGDCATNGATGGQGDSNRLTCRTPHAWIARANKSGPLPCFPGYFAP
jgi:hypothetical protein